MAELADAVHLKTVVSLPNELLPLVYVRTLATKNDHSDAHTVNMVSTIALLVRSNTSLFALAGAPRATDVSPAARWMSIRGVHSRS